MSFLEWLGVPGQWAIDGAPLATLILALVVLFGGFRVTTQLQQIHVLVNSRLSVALRKIGRLEKQLYKLTGEKPTDEDDTEDYVDEEVEKQKEEVHGRTG